MKAVAGVVSILSLAVCYLIPLLYMRSALGLDQFKHLLLAASLVYFAAAAVWAVQAGRASRQ
jgi:hypothetical protein